jgi:putative holliday junction resolvase
LQITTRPLPLILRKNWKAVLASIAGVVEQFDVKAVVLGLPLRLDGTEGDAAANIRRIARNLHLSLGIPVFLHNESLTSMEASQRLAAKGIQLSDSKHFLDSEAACVILEDFVGTKASFEGHSDTATE